MWPKFKNLLPYFAVVLVITLPWFFHRGFLFLTDFSWGPNLPIDLYRSDLLLNFILKIFSYVLPLDFLQKIFVSGVLLLVLLGGKKVAENFALPKSWVFIISLFCLFNPFVYDRCLYGQFSVVAAFGFFLLAAGFLLEFYRKSLLYPLLYFGLFTGLAGLFSPHFLFFCATLYLAIFAAWLLSPRKKMLKYAGLELLTTTLIVALTILLLNFNWMWGLLFAKSTLHSFIIGGIGNQDLVAFQTAGRTGGEALKNVLMMSGFWGKDQFRYLDLTANLASWGRSFVVLLPVILYGLYSGLKRKQTRGLSLSLVALFVLATLLAVGIRLPASKALTLWLFNYLPFYKGLRESQKWVSVIVLIYAIFLCIAVEKFLSLSVTKYNSLLIKMFLGLAIFMMAPVLVWGFFGQVQPAQYPTDWKIADKYIVNNGNCRGNTLFLPWHLYMSFYWEGKVTANPANQFFTCNIFQGTDQEFGGIYNNSADPVSTKIQYWLQSRGQGNFLIENSLNMTYVILAKEVDWLNYSWLDSNSNLKLVSETQTLKIYKVNSSLVN